MAKDESKFIIKSIESIQKEVKGISNVVKWWDKKRYRKRYTKTHNIRYKNKELGDENARLKEELRKLNNLLDKHCK